MPTGYTAKVGDGTVQKFEAFALQCARAFGALVTMRDDPNDAPIPEAFEASTYYSDSLAKHRDELERLREMTPEQASAASAEAFDASVRAALRRKEERNAIRARYEAMLVQVNAWEPPSADHAEMKRFMVQQLTESIEFDCRGYDFDRPSAPMSGDEWLAAQIADEERGIAYAEQEIAKETQRTRERNEWLRLLRESLKPTPNAVAATD